MENKQTYTNRNLNDDFARLYFKERFFSIAAFRCKRYLSKTVPTAGVIFHKTTGYFDMVFNPDFMVKLTENQRQTIIIHEILHLLLMHVGMRVPDRINARYWQAAIDLATNDLILQKMSRGREDLPGSPWIPGEFPCEPYPHDMSAEQYMSLVMKDNKVKKMVDEQECPGDCNDCPFNITNALDGGNGGVICKNLDSHLWKNGEGDREAIRRAAKQLLAGTIREANMSKGWGNLPSDVIKYLKSLVSNTINWKHLIYRFVSYAKSSSFHSTIRKLNRRYGNIHPGHDRDRFSRLAFCWDESASVPDWALSKISAETQNLLRLTDITIIPFDTGIDEGNILKLRKGQKLIPKRVHEGGTNFGPAIEYVNKNHRDFDGIMIFTDLEAPYPGPSKMRRIWITWAGCEPFADEDKWAKEIVIKIPEFFE